MPVPFSGGCACGAFRYTSAAEPLFAVYCRCRNCQRASGGAYATVVLVPREAEFSGVLPTIGKQPG